jgi:hypothetical protein
VGDRWWGRAYFPSIRRNRKSIFPVRDLSMTSGFYILQSSTCLITGRLPGHGGTDSPVSFRRCRCTSIFHIPTILIFTCNVIWERERIAYTCHVCAKCIPPKPIRMYVRPSSWRRYFSVRTFDTIRADEPTTRRHSVFAHQDILSVYTALCVHHFKIHIYIRKWYSSVKKKQDKVRTML